MQPTLFRQAAVIALLVFAFISVPLRGAGLNSIPIVTSAQGTSSDGTLTISGRDFIITPAPRVWLGTQGGEFEQLVVLFAGPSSIQAVLGNRQPGTYRLVVQFGQTGLLLSSLDVTLGAVGPQGQSGVPGPPGPTGPPGVVGLAGQSCQSGSFLTGFDAAGNLVCAVIPPSPPVPPQASDTILLWHLDEGSGSTAGDASGNGRNGSVVSATWTTGRFGQGLSLAGGSAGSQYVVLADADALTPSALTVDLWIKPSRLDIDNQMIVHKYQNNVPSNSDYILRA